MLSIQSSEFHCVSFRKINKFVTSKLMYFFTNCPSIVYILHYNENQLGVPGRILFLSKYFLNPSFAWSSAVESSCAFFSSAFGKIFGNWNLTSFGCWLKTKIEPMKSFTHSKLISIFLPMLHRQI